MTHPQLKSTLNSALKKLAARSGIVVYNEFDLREARKKKQEVAAKHKGWTLFINKKGTLCHSVHKKGTLCILEAPEYFANCFHSEHVTNYFINHIRSIASV